MDPFLEGYLWPDLHNALANKIRQLLAPLLRPRYTARLGIYVIEDTAPESDAGILYPDVEIIQGPTSPLRESPPPSPPEVITPPDLSIPVTSPVEVPLTSVEIRDAASNQLVTSIEILSPVNKREPGLRAYRLKRGRLYQAGVHLIEIDLVRRGTRPVSHPRLQGAQYVVTLTRSHVRKTDVWPLSLRDPLPTLPVPLRPPDADVGLSLGSALNLVYDEAAYELSVDYGQDPPPPALPALDRAWARELVRARRSAAR
jgi:hypothetical protein